MNPLKRIWCYYIYLNDIDRSFIKAHSHDGREKQDQLILKLVGEKKSKKQTFWFILGIPLIISFLGWALFKDVIKRQVSLIGLPEGGLFGLIEEVFPFFLIVCVSYILGAVFGGFWRLSKTHQFCSKCGSPLTCKHSHENDETKADD